MGWGRRILLGFNLFWSTMCFFVVRTNHIGSTLEAASEELSEVSARRFRVLEDVSLR